MHFHDLQPAYQTHARMEDGVYLETMVKALYADADLALKEEPVKVVKAYG